jgi:hypothetical protein
MSWCRIYFDVAPDDSLLAAGLVRYATAEGAAQPLERYEAPRAVLLSNRLQLFWALLDMALDGVGAVRTTREWLEPELPLDGPFDDEKF